MSRFVSALLVRLRNPRWAILAVCIVLLISVGSFFLIRDALDPYDCRILDNVYLGGIHVGGMTRQEARQALKEAEASTLGSVDLLIRLPEGSISLSPANTKIRIRVYSAVQAAYAYGRTGSQEARQAAYDSSRVSEFHIGLGPYLRYDEAYIRRELEAYAQEHDTSLTGFYYRIDGEMPELGTDVYDEAAPCQTLVMTLGLPEAHLDVDGAMEQIAALWDCPFPAAASGSYAVDIEVVPDVLPEAPDWNALYEKYRIEPVNDSLDMQTYQPVSGSYGYEFDPEAAAKAAEAAHWGETLSIPMYCVPPEILGEGVYYRDILGSCETKHTDNENRNTNLRLVCQLLDGMVIQPGEVFSYNGAVGERTAERGFKSAGAYSGNRLINSIGGGVCQGSTTIYNCALLADLEIVERYCHGFTVTYVPIGLDAAVNWATATDLKFRNNTHFPIMIRAQLSDGYMKIQLLGTDEKDYYIVMEATHSYEEKRIYANSYKCKFDKETGELISRELEARSAYMYFEG